MSNNQNPLLARLQLPGQTFRLPSHGLFYKDGELRDDVKDGEVHVFPMTAYDEIVFKTPDMLLSGKAIDEVFGRCIPQVLKPRQLLSKDVDYLITCLRVITYGPEITLTYTHNCEGAKQREYTTNLNALIGQAKSIDPTTIANNYVVTLENGQVVRLRPTLFSTVLELNQQIGKDSDASLMDIQNNILKVLIEMVEMVDDVSDRSQIAEWVQALPAGWVRLLSDAIEKTSDWGVEFKAEQVCKDCGQAIVMPFSANPVSFFS